MRVKDFLRRLLRLDEPGTSLESKLAGEVVDLEIKLAAASTEHYNLLVRAVTAENQLAQVKRASAIKVEVFRAGDGRVFANVLRPGPTHYQQLAHLRVGESWDSTKEKK